MAYCVFRSDLMSSVPQYADLVSVRVYDGTGANANPIEVENGVIVKLGGYEDGQREVIKATLATSSDKLHECAIIDGVELMYDERKHRLDEYINEAGKAIRGRIPRSRNLFSVTKEGFVGGTAPAKGGSVGIGAGGKLDASGTGVGKCEEIETSGAYTYYLIRIGAAEEDE